MSRPPIPDTHYYRGDYCNWMPTKANMKESNHLHKHILQGWLPPSPFITKEHTIIAFGSCFAEHILNLLQGWGYKVGNSKSKPTHHGTTTHVANHGDGMANTFTVRQQFEWAYENKQFVEDLWYYSSKEEAAAKDEAIRQETKRLFDETDVFIITLGLSEVWYDKASGDVFWRAVPDTKFDKDKHGFRVSTCAENIDNMEKIIELIRKHRPQATIIFTLSPVGLLATFRPVSCITANSVSKAILRASVDEVIRNHANDKNIFYWPSYEMIMEGMSEPFIEDRRHPVPTNVSTIMQLFKQFYLKG